MAEIIDIEEAMPHVMHEVVCLKCLGRHIAVAPAVTPLKLYECSNCGETGHMICTGQEFDEENRPRFI